MRLVAVTGASRGVGRAVALRFAGAGDRVLALGRDEAALAETAAAGPPDAVEVAVCDVTDEASVAAAFDDRAVDVLVNNAGVSSSAPLERSTLADWRAQMDANAAGAFLCTRAVLGGMRARDRGRVVMVASTAGLVGAPYTAAYTASKHAMVGLMRAVASEVAGSGVTCNAVCPGFVDTEMTARSVARIVEVTGRSAEQATAALERSSPLGRLLAPEEVAAAVAFLASDEARAINGQTLVLDGGGIQA